MDALRYRVEIRWLYQAALLLFLVTIAVGMARGLGLIDFADRNQFLTHLHSGVIGWITLGIIATVLWIYGGTAARDQDDRYVTWTAIVLIVSVPEYSSRSRCWRTSCRSPRCTPRSTSRRSCCS